MSEHGSASRNASLIGGLTESLEPVRRRRPGREAGILFGIALLQLIGTMALFGSKAAMVFEANMTVSVAKAILLAGFTLGFAALAFRSLEPTAPRSRKLALGLTAFLAAFAVLIFDWNFSGGAARVLSPPNGVVCLVSSVSFAMPMFIILTMFLRGAAPIRPRMSALFIGLASGSWGVFVYSLQCPFTNIAYMALWYGGAVAIVTLAAAAILPRLARW
jgi:hypothetical protein